jgi:glutathione S-transferase
VEYVLTKYGNGNLTLGPEADNYANYLYFLHFTNGTLQPALLRSRLVDAAGLSSDNVSARLAKTSRDKSFRILEDRLSKNKWLAGDAFTAADIMVVFSLTTMRLFYPYSLEGFDGIIGFLQRIGQREAYRRAMEKSDPGFQPLLSPEKPEPVRK